MKDDQIKRILIQLESSVEEWDSCKCPTVKWVNSHTLSKSLLDNSRAHIDRVKKAEGVETEEKECPEPEPETGAAMKMTTSTSSLLTITTFLAIFFKLSHL